MIQQMETRLAAIAATIASNRYLSAITAGFGLIGPWWIVTSLVALAATLRLPGWSAMMDTVLANGTMVSDYLLWPAKMMIDFAAVILVVAIAFELAQKLDVKPGAGIIASLLGWLVLLPGGDVYTYLGLDGIGSGILITMFVVTAMARWQNAGTVIKTPAQVPPSVIDSMTSLIPWRGVIAVLVLFKLGSAIAGINVVVAVATLIQTSLLNWGDTLAAMIIAYLILHLFWLFGANGGSVVGAVFNPILMVLSLENLAALVNHQPPVHIITHQFQNFFATFGESGSVLSLAVALALCTRSKKFRELHQTALMPSLFGISEPLVFGLPIEIRSLIAIPFVLVPTLNIVITYFAMSTGLVPLTNGVQLPWTVPAVVSGLVVSGWQGALLQAGLIILGVMVYLPFIKMRDKHEHDMERKVKVIDDNETENLKKETM